MALTRHFRKTVVERARISPTFRRGLLTRGVSQILTGDEEDRAVGKSLLRDYIDATIGFQQLAAELDRKPQSVMRMFSRDGNPRLSSLAEVVQHLQMHEKVQLQVKAK